MSDDAPGERVAQLSRRYGELAAEALLRPVIESEFSGRIALVSSCGAEAAVLLHLVARIDRRVPVLFVDTGKLFGKTLQYRADLVERLGFKDVRTVRPEPPRLAAGDPSIGCVPYTRPVALDGVDGSVSAPKNVPSPGRAPVLARDRFGTDLR